MSLQDRRLNMDQLRQVKPVGSSFPFDDPTMELERLLPQAAPQLGRMGYQPTSVDEMAMLESRSFAAPAHMGMEHEASRKPYDPLSKYSLTMGEEFLDIFLGGDTRKVKKKSPCVNTKAPIALFIYAIYDSKNWLLDGCWSLLSAFFSIWRIRSFVR